jgi:hypothetical protein
MIEVLKSRPARVGSVALWMVCVTILLFGALHKAHRPNGNDLTLYLDTARGLLAGRHPYGVPAMFAYAYPLFLAAVLAPLAVLPLDLAVVIWFIGCVAALAYAARVTVALARERGIVRRDVPLTVPLVALWFLLLDPIQSDLLNGQTNFPVLLLCVLCLRALFRGNTLGMAGSLAIAIAVKITPALLLGFLAVRRRWRAIALSLGLAAILVLAPLALVGQGLAPYRAYLDSFLLARVRGEFLTPQGVRFSVNGVLEKIVPTWGAAPWRRVLGGTLPLLGLAMIEWVARRRDANVRGAPSDVRLPGLGARAAGLVAGRSRVVVPPSPRRWRRVLAPPPGRPPRPRRSLVLSRSVPPGRSRRCRGDGAPNGGRRWDACLGPGVRRGWPLTERAGWPRMACHGLPRTSIR